MNYIDIIVVVIYLGICLGMGFIKSVKSADVREFSFYRNISLPALVCTLFASSIGAGSSILEAGDIYKHGMIFAVTHMFISVYWLTSIFIIVPGVSKFRGCITISDIMNKLYGRWGEAISAWLMLAASVAFLSIQTIALGEVFHYFFNISANLGIWLSYLIIITYSVFGGIKAVIYNDIFKTIIVFLVLPIACVSVLANSGGIQAVIPNLPASHLTLSLDTQNIALMISLSFAFILPSFDAPLVQRYLMARNTKQLKQAFLWVFVCSLAFSLSLPIIAYLVRASYPNIEPGNTFFYFIDYFMPIGAKGFMIAGLMAIIMSMAEVLLNSSALLVYNNILLPSIDVSKVSEKTKLYIFKGIICFIAVLSILLVGKFSNNNFLWMVENFMASILFIPALVGFIGFRTNNLSFKCSTLATTFTILSYSIYTNGFTTIGMILGISVCTISFFATHYLQVAIGKTPYIKQVFNITNYSEIIKFWQAWKINLSINYQNQEKKDPKYIGFLIFAFFFELLYFSYMTMYGGFSTTLLALLCICHVLCLIMALRETVFISGWLQKLLPLYFKMALILALPTLSSYILFTHSQYNFWLIMGILSALSLNYVIDALRAIMYYTFGVILAYTLIVFSGEIFSPSFSFKSILFIYAYFIFTSYIIVRKEEEFREERLDKMSLFGSAIAHEVRTPLASLNMCAQLIDSILLQNHHDNKIVVKGEDAQTLLDMSKTLLNTSLKGIKTVEALLAAVRKDISTSDFQLYSMAKIVSDSIVEFCTFVDKKNKIHLIVTEDFEVYCSAKYMEYVLINLLKNAFRHGGPYVEVEIIINDNMIIIRDNGYGIAEEVQPYIFERFYTNSKNGVGIGLAFCKMVVEKMNGEIYCDSVTGQHTTFTINFAEN